MRVIPRRTLLLMVLALAAFGRFWCATHPTAPPAQPPKPLEVQVR